MPITLIASDMDGTLLKDRDSISQFSAETIKSIQKQGISFVACTGRTLAQARGPLNEQGISCPIIALNGAQIYDENNQLLHQSTIPKEIGRELIKEIESSLCFVELITDKGIYMRTREARIESFKSYFKFSNQHIPHEQLLDSLKDLEQTFGLEYEADFDTLLDQEDLNLLKLSVFPQHSIAVLKALQRDLASRFSMVSVTSSGIGNIEINSKEGQKGAALTYFAKKFGHDLENTLTIGDNLNDISMLKVSGHSYAMANGAKETKIAAQFLAKSNKEDGVAYAILDALSRIENT
ncbi:HAD family hydrolase [Atopobacter sp. AH10]|uniref:HAD family hydrolase n=1 Tax=Atopobacter sp. AH10 TaxID=2315861 RepID=UPI001314898C|nr:HAD family hydrolase [Atopobacter sp. AH10]